MESVYLVDIPVRGIADGSELLQEHKGFCFFGTQLVILELREPGYIAGIHEVVSEKGKDEAVRLPVGLEVGT